MLSVTDDIFALVVLHVSVIAGAAPRTATAFKAHPSPGASEEFPWLFESLWRQIKAWIRNSELVGLLGYSDLPVRSQIERGEAAVQRRVQFWRVVGSDLEPMSFEFPATKVSELLKVAEATRVDRNHRCSDGEVVQAQAFPARVPSLILYTLRRSNLPRRESNGVITPLVLNVNESLAEATYFSFFPRNVVGVLYNQMGPSHSRLEEYLRARFNQDISLVPIYREDSMAIIAALNVSSVRIGIPSDQVQYLSPHSGQAKQWAQALDQMATLAGGGVVEAGFSVGTVGPVAKRQATKGKIKSVFQKFFNNVDLHRFTKVVVEGRDAASNEQVIVNLLHDRLVQSVEVEETPTGQLDRTSELSTDSLQSAWSVTEHVINDLIEDLPHDAQSIIASKAAASALTYIPQASISSNRP